MPLCACQEVWEWPCTQALYTAAISLDGCVQGVCTRVARVGGRCAVVWLTSEWCSVCCTCTEGSPSSCARSQSLNVLGLVASGHTLSHPSPPHTHTQVSILVMFRTVLKVAPSSCIRFQCLIALLRFVTASYSPAHQGSGLGM